MGHHVHGRPISDERAAELEVLWRTSWGRMTMHQYEQLMTWRLVKSGAVPLDASGMYHYVPVKGGDL